MIPGALNHMMMAGFDPSQLFANSEYGGWYDPSDLSTLWQDTSRTTPVTSSGQTVRAIDDKSGNGITLTLAGGVGPTYQASGGISWLEFNGDSWFTSAALTATLLYGNGALMAAAATDDPEGNDAVLFEGNESVSDRFGIMYSTINNGLLGVFRGLDDANNFLYLDTELSGGATVLGVINSGNVVTGYYNNTAIATTSNITSNFQTSRYLYLGRYPASSVPALLDGKFYGGIILDRALISIERTNVNSWLSKKAGC